MRLSTQLQSAEWSDDAARALTPALDGADLSAFETAVKDGSMQLWECNGCYCVTEIDDTVFHVWLVGGENFVDCAHAINNALHECGFMYARFRTRNPASLRMYGFLNPEVINAELHEYRAWPFT